MSEYQAQAAQFISPDEPNPTLYVFEYVTDALGEEMGEIKGVFSKARRNRQPVNVDRLRSEIGDLLWNVAAICTALGMEYAAIDPLPQAPAMHGRRLRVRIERTACLIADALATNADDGKATYKATYFLPLIGKLLADVDSLLAEHDLTRAACEAQNIEDLTARQAQRAAAL